MKPSYIVPEKLAKRIGGQVPIIWAPVPLLVFRQEDRGKGAHNIGTCPLARLSLLSMRNHGFVFQLAIRFSFNIDLTWCPRARQEESETGAYNRDTCLIGHRSLLAMLDHQFVMELAIRLCFQYRFNLVSKSSPRGEEDRCL